MVKIIPELMDIYGGRKMTGEVKDQIVADALKNGYLIEVCAGCRHPTTEQGAKFMKVVFRENHDCPCGTMIIWNPLLTIK